MPSRPFRFGVATGSAHSRAEWESRARRAEELGYATLVVADHLATGLASLSALAIAAETTTRLRIGSLVFNNDFRHPALLAREAATLDLLSDGRFEFGLGAGYLPDDYTQLGLIFDAPGTRISRLEEAIQLIVRLWTEESVTFAGTFYTLTEMQGKPKPLQRPHPPLYIGGTAKRILSLAARYADSVGIGFAAWGEQASSVTPEAIAQKVAWVREAAGQRFERLELSFTLFHLVITESTRHHAGERSVSASPDASPSAPSRVWGAWWSGLCVILPSGSPGGASSRSSMWQCIGIWYYSSRVVVRPWLWPPRLSVGSVCGPRGE
jgi:probable F420-dependent oxidoreductase